METYFVCEHDAGNAFRIPEQLVYIIIANDAIVITFPSHKFAINSLVALVTNEAIKGLDNRAKVESFRHRVDAGLAFRRAVVVVCTFENKAETLGNESDLSGLSPAQEIKGNLTHAIILGHVVHRLTPAFEGTGQGFLGMIATTTTLRAEALKTGVLSMTDSVVEIKLSSKVPLAIICVLASDVVRMKGEECLIWGHTRRTTVKQLHREVELSEL